MTQEELIRTAARETLDELIRAAKPGFFTKLIGQERLKGLENFFLRPATEKSKGALGGFIDFFTQPVFGKKAKKAAPAIIDRLRLGRVAAVGGTGLLSALGLGSLLFPRRRS